MSAPALSDADLLNSADPGALPAYGAAMRARDWAAASAAALRLVRICAGAADVFGAVHWAEEAVFLGRRAACLATRAGLLA